MFRTGSIGCAQIFFFRKVHVLVHEAPEKAATPSTVRKTTIKRASLRTPGIRMYRTLEKELIPSSLAASNCHRGMPSNAQRILCALEGIPRWQFEAAKLEGMSSFSRVRYILIPGVRKLALFIVVFLTVDGVAAFSGASCTSTCTFLKKKI